MRAAPPLRSVLFIAGTDAHGLERAFDHGADALIIDLEEPQMPMNEKVRQQGRELVSTFLDDAPAERPVLFCRVQPARTGGMWADLMACLRPALDGIALPKSYSPADMNAPHCSIWSTDRP